jgi:glycosyltransferase involved in cell wall biosynthesis
MRLLWLGHFLPYPPRGGNLQRSHHLLRVAAELHEVHLVSLTQRAILPSSESVREACDALRPLVASLSVHEIPADRSRARWYGLVVRALFDWRPYDELWFAQPTLHEAVAALVRSHGPFDLVHADTLSLWPNARRAAPAPVVVNHHNIESHIMRRRAEREPHPLRRLYFARDARKLARAEARVCPRAAMNLVVSDLDGQRLRQTAPGARVRVVDNGVDTAYFRPTAAPGRPGDLVFVGSMSWYPNADAARFLVDEIWPPVRASDPSVRLTVVGPNPPPDLLASASGDERLTITGFVEDVRPFLDDAGIYVCPIRDGGGTRLKVLDALSMAKPLVATALAVEGLGLEPEVDYLAAESPVDFVRQIGRLRRDPDLRARLGSGGRRLVQERYAWPAVGKKLAAAYDAALAPTPACR